MSQKLGFWLLYIYLSETYCEDTKYGFKTEDVQTLERSAFVPFNNILPSGFIRLFLLFFLLLQILIKLKETCSYNVPRLNRLGVTRYMQLYIDKCTAIPHTYTQTGIDPRPHPHPTPPLHTQPLMLTKIVFIHGQPHTVFGGVVSIFGGWMVLY